MDKRQAKIVNYLITRNKEVAVSKIASDCSISESDVLTELSVLAVRNTVSVTKGTSGKIKKAKANESARKTFELYAMGNTNIQDELNKLSSAVKEIQNAMIELQQSSPSDRGNILENINNALQIVNGAPGLVSIVQQIIHSL